MPLNMYEKYAALASEMGYSNIEISGRYAFQLEDEKRIVPDITKKLELNLEDSLLDIGSGPGNILLPLLKMVGSAAAIDSEPMLRRLRSRLDKHDKVECYPGNFLTMELPQKSFDKILIYSVIHYLESQDSVLEFIDRALSLVSPGGRLLVGDLPNVDKKRRFLQSHKGQEIMKIWSRKTRNISLKAQSFLSTYKDSVDIDDDFIIKILRFGRERGFESYLLSQPEGLPFCYTREDILFISHC